MTDAYTTDPQVKRNNLVVLTDNQALSPPYQAEALMKMIFAKQPPKIVTSLANLSQQVSTADMQTINYQVTVKHQKSAVWQPIIT